MVFWLAVVLGHRRSDRCTGLRRPAHGHPRHAWRLTQSSADGLSLNRYQELLDADAFNGPSAVRIVQIFGSWSRAADVAGVPSGPTPNRLYSSQWSDGQILAFVVRYLATPHTTGSFAGWDPWRREYAPEAPSSALLRLCLGEWSDIKALALASVVADGGSDTQSPDEHA